MSALRRSSLVQGAATALGLSLVVFGWALWRTVVIEPVAQPPGAGGGASPVETPGRRPLYPTGRVFAALDKDPFHPERRRPGVPFRLPSEAAPVVTAAQEPAAGVQLLGTAVAPGGGGVAMFRWPGSTPRLVRVGERVNGLTLKRVRPGEAEILSEAGTTVVLRVPKAGT